MTPTALAAELVAGYAEEAGLYRQALAEANLLPDALERGESADPILARINGMLLQVQKVEDRLAPIKTRWRDADVEHNTAVKDVLSQVAELIWLLQAQMKNAQARTRQKANALAPALDEMIRRQHMRRAYGAVQPTSQDQGGPDYGR